MTKISFLHALVIMGILLMSVISCNKSNITVTDIDGNVYQTVTIGQQVWMAENLKVTRYRNGDAIPNITDDETWRNLSTGAYCDYNNDPNHANTYGRLYNWFAVNDERKIAPEGWHIPTKAEWQKLADYLGGNHRAGGKLKEKKTLHWDNPNTGATNQSGFTALPGGNRNNDGFFENLRYSGGWWTANGSEADFAYDRNLTCNSREIAPDIDDKKYGFSLRCVKD